MPSSHPPSKSKLELLDNHQRCWIWGKNTVLETLRAGHWKIWELHYDHSLPASVIQELTILAFKLKTMLVKSDSPSLEKQCKSNEHQGLIAKMAPFPYATFDDLTALITTKQFCSILLLDRIQDPFNFGGIIRSAAGLGTDAILIGQNAQSGVNSLTARASSGIVNYIPIVRVPELRESLTQLKSLQLSIYATSGHKNAALLNTITFSQRHIIMIGSEAHGLSDDLISQAHAIVKIPLSSTVESLNAAVAAGIICYEAQRQRGFT